MKGAVTTVVFIIVGLAAVGALSYNALQNSFSSLPTGRVIQTDSDGLSGSCVNACGTKSADGCWCDVSSLTTYHDNCQDIQTACLLIYSAATGSSIASDPTVSGSTSESNVGSSGSCTEKCGSPYNSNFPCQCDTDKYGDQCSDYSNICIASEASSKGPGLSTIVSQNPTSSSSGSCIGKCGSPYNSNFPCQCDTDKYGDQCADYKSVCGGASITPQPTQTPPGVFAPAPVQPSLITADNLLYNPGFESVKNDEPIDWAFSVLASSLQFTITHVVNSNHAHSGLASVKLNSSSEDGYGSIVYNHNPTEGLYGKIIIEPGNTYLLKSWIKTMGVSNQKYFHGAKLHVFASNSENTKIYSNFQSTPLTGTNDWKEQKLLFYSGDYDWIQVTLDLIGKGTAYFDDVSLQKFGSPTVSKHLILVFPPDEIESNNFDSSSKWAQKIDDAYEALSALMGKAPYDGEKIQVSHILNYPYGATAGNPITLGAIFDEFVKSNKDDVSFSFGMVHEVSHDFDSILVPNAPHYVWDDPYIVGDYYIGWKEYKGYVVDSVDIKSPINLETWANLKALYVFDTLTAKYPNGVVYMYDTGYPISEVGQKFIKEYNNWGVPGDWQKMPHDAYLGFLYSLAKKVGWKPFELTFRDYQKLTTPPPGTDLGKIELFANLLSKNAGINLVPEFQKLGIPIKLDPTINLCSVVTTCKPISKVCSDGSAASCIPTCAPSAGCGTCQPSCAK